MSASFDTSAVERAAMQLRDRRITVLTGAGISTDSGIPDYRGPGAEVRTPMTGQRFLADPEARRRYWAGSHLGWRLMGRARPNPAHVMLAEWERRGRVHGVLTQNVDGLHRQAGSASVVELHGSLDRVNCLRCGQGFAREAVAAQISAENPWLEAWGESDADRLAPDGDADVPELSGFRAPLCSVCRGVLKPDVVFFGETVPVARFARAGDYIRGGNALLVLGSSLTVNTGIRLLDRARRDGSPIITVNRGRTGGASRATTVIEGSVAPVLFALDGLLNSDR